MPRPEDTPWSRKRCLRPLRHWPRNSSSRKPPATARAPKRGLLSTPCCLQNCKRPSARFPIFPWMWNLFILLRRPFDDRAEFCQSRKDRAGISFFCAAGVASQRRLVSLPLEGFAMVARRRGLGIDLRRHIDGFPAGTDVRLVGAGPRDPYGRAPALRAIAAAGFT